MTTTPNQKIALITGANKGIGYGTAEQLGSLGMQVIVAARDLAKAQAATAALRAEGLNATPLKLDVTSDEDIAAAARWVEVEYGRLDVLVNNAGVMHDDLRKKPSQQSMATWRSSFDTNLFGLVAVTQAFLPLLKASAAGRIVNLSSILSSNTLHQQKDSGIYDMKAPAYNVSKAAVNAWTVQLAWELKDTAIKVNAIHPGHVRTDMGGPGAPMSQAEGAATTVWAATLPADGPSGGFFHQGQVFPW